MIYKILNKFDTVLYAQIWEERIRVINVATKEVFDEKALIAIKTENGKKLIEAVGSDALLASNMNTIVSKPFSHKRLLLSNFVLAEKLLQHTFYTLLKGKIFGIRPKVVIHPMKKVDGGLGDIEVTAFMDLAIGAGARDVKVHQGNTLSIQNFDYDSLPKK